MRALCVLIVAGVIMGACAFSASAQEKVTITIPAVSYTAVEGGKVRTQVAAGDKKKGGAAECIQFWATPGHWLEWTVEDAAAGDYELVLNYAGMHAVRRSLAVSGKIVKGLEDLTVPRTGNWDTAADWKAATAVTLAPGSNVLRMTCLDESSIRLQSIRMKGPGGKEVTLKGTAFTGQGGGQVNSVFPQTLGYVNWEGVNEEKPDRGGPPQFGMALEWSVKDARAGLYRIALHYTSDGSCRLELSANGAVVKGLESFVLPRTGNDSTWVKGSLPIPVTLKEGANTLKLRMLGKKKEKGEHPVPDLTAVDFALSSLHLVPVAEGAAPDLDTLDILALDRLLAELKQRKKPDMPPAPLGPPLPKVEGGITPAEGQTVNLGGRTATFTKVDLLPFVDSKHSRLFTFENYDHPDLQAFCEKYRLKEVIAPGKDEFEKQLRLMAWVWSQWRFGQGRELYYLDDPFWILAEARKEHKFQCMHSFSVLHTAANSLGWVSRPMTAPSHSYNEIWSNQHRKWVQFDATGNWAPTKDGVPQSTHETRVSWLSEKEKSGVQRSHWEEGGIKTVPSKSFVGLRNIGFLTTCNVLGNARYDFDYQRRFFSIKDDFAKGDYHPNDLLTTNPAVDPYFPINQAALALVPEGESIKVTLGTMTPNFKEFRIRLDGGEWKATEPAFVWKIHDGENRLEAVSVNKFGVEGPVSTVVLKAGK